MADRIIHWSHPPYQPKWWTTILPGVGTYLVKNEGHSRKWVASFDGRPTTFTGSNAQAVKVQCERAIRAYELNSKRGRRK